MIALTEFEKCLNNTLRHMMGLFVMCCSGPGIGLDDSCGSFPAQHILIMALHYNTFILNILWGERMKPGGATERGFPKG